MSDTLNALAGSGKRVVVMDAQMVTKLPKEAKALVGQAAADQGVDSAVVVRHAIAEYLQRRGYLKQ